MTGAMSDLPVWVERIEAVVDGIAEGVEALLQDRQHPQTVTVGVAPDVLAVLDRIAAALATLAAGSGPSPAVGAVLAVKERIPAPMPVSISVDAVNEVVTVEFVDDHGDTDAAAPTGLTAAFSSDTPTVLTVSNDQTNPLQGDITLVAEGTANVSCTLADANGNSPPVVNGVTWAALAPVAVTVVAGAAVGAELAIQQ